MGLPSNWKMDIAIPQYKSIEMLKRCLSSLANINIPNNVDTIWIVENGGVFGAHSIVESFKPLIPVKYLNLDEGNLSKARNLALATSTSDIIFFFDNDITFDENSLVSYFNSLELYKGQQIGFFGGPLTPLYERPPANYLKPYLPKSVVGYHPFNYDKVVDSPDFLGGNHGILVSLAKSIGGYDVGSASGNNSGLVGEETRLMEKIISKGYTGLFCFGANVHHYIPKDNCTTTWTLKRTYRHGLTDSILEGPTKGRSLFNIPLYLYKMFVVNTLKFILPRERTRFFHINKVAFCLGKMAGFRRGYSIRNGS